MREKQIWTHLSTITKFKTGQNILNTYSQILDSRQHRTVIFEGGETNEMTPMIAPAFYLERFSKILAQVGKLSKECWVEKTEFGVVSKWLEFMGHITWEEEAIPRNSPRILHGVHLTPWLIANLCMFRAKFYHAGQKTTSGERILPKICKPNKSQSSHKHRNCSSFHHPDWRDHIEYVKPPVETPNQIKPQ